MQDRIAEAVTCSREVLPVAGSTGEIERDTDSVSERTAKWTYVPLMYYVISRLHGKGVATLLLREVIPFTLAGYLLLDAGWVSFVAVPLAILMFYSVYEIGGLVNDLLAHREGLAGRTNRISAGTRINVGAFVAIRVALVGLLLTGLPAGVYPVVPYVVSLCCCLAIYLIHSLILSNLRIITFVLLRVCRSSIPLMILASRVPPAELAYVCLIFFLAEAPSRVYLYCCTRGLIERKMSVLYVRCLDEAILCGLGVAVYLINGSPHLLAIASYYLGGDCLWSICRVCYQGNSLLKRRML
jgi:hypothetical protein